MKAEFYLALNFGDDLSTVYLIRYGVLPFFPRKGDAFELGFNYIVKRSEYDLLGAVARVYFVDREYNSIDLEVAINVLKDMSDYWNILDYENGAEKLVQSPPIRFAYAEANRV